MMNKFRPTFVGLVVLLFLCGCSEIQFKTSNKIAHWGQKRTRVYDEFEIEGQRSFYLWGYYPENHVVNIDDELINKGYSYAFDLQIEEYQSLKNFFYGVITLGMYVPRNYVLRGKGRMRD